MRACAIVLAGVLAAAAAAQPPADGDPLTRLEDALKADPDNLRAGNDYRLAIVRAGQYDRAIAFFASLVAAHPAAANAHMNFGFAYVDKIPAAGAITQVILANDALTEFSRALELGPSWLGYYTRGNSYLFWPKIFDRTRLGVADLEEAMRIQGAGATRAYHVRTFIALGDGYWKMGDRARAKATWRDGLAAFPDNAALKARAAATAKRLDAILDETYDPQRRVDTNLTELWTR
jgi:tetratricopeptide (TPR) repeat protein